MPSSARARALRRNAGAASSRRAEPGDASVGSSTSSSVSSRATSVRHTGSRLASDARTALLRSSSVMGPNARRPSASYGARPGRRHAARIGPRQGFLCETRLADAGVAGNQDECRRARAGPLPRARRSVPIRPRVRPAVVLPTRRFGAAGRPPAGSISCTRRGSRRRVWRRARARAVSAYASYTCRADGEVAGTGVDAEEGADNWLHAPDRVRRVDVPARSPPSDPVPPRAVATTSQVTAARRSAIVRAPA